MALSISPLEIAKLPRLTFGGRTLIVSCPEDEERAAALFKDERLLGFDSESRPSSALGPKNRTALVQVATENVVCIWRMCAMKTMPPLLRRLLEDASVQKVAQGAAGEVASLREEFGVGAQAFIDLHHVALSLRTTPRSLQGLVALFLRRRLGKEQRLSDWEQEPLTQAQIDYAALDAYASRQVLVAIRRAYQAERLTCERLLGSAAGLPQPFALAAQRAATELAAGGFPLGPASRTSRFARPRDEETEGAPDLASPRAVAPAQAAAQAATGQEQAHQKLVALCVSKGYVLRFDGFESAPGGFRCAFRVEYRLQGRSTAEVFRSRRVHPSIRGAQNDAALEALARLSEEPPEHPGAA